MGLLKKIIKMLPIPIFVFILGVPAWAADSGAAAKTGDDALIWIAVAVAACVATAFITMKLTKYKNKKIK